MVNFNASNETNILRTQKSFIYCDFLCVSNIKINIKNHEQNAYNLK
jgi:hypothetical protein